MEGVKKIRGGSLIGRTFGRLIVIDSSGFNKHRNTLWKVRCACGSEKVVARGDLVSGDTKSCGCLHDECSRNRKLTHGLSHIRMYRIWAMMCNRCRNTIDPNYPYYGGRGIKVCERWKQFENFYSEMLEGYRDGLTIERKDNKGDYCKENCRWASRKDQARNRRSSRWITFRGRTQSLIQWCEELKIPYYRTRARIYRGRTTEEAFTK